MQRGQWKEWTEVVKDLGAFTKDLFLGLSVIALVAWLVFGGAIDKMKTVEVPGGLKLEFKEASKAAADAAVQFEKVRSDLITVQGQVEQSKNALVAFKAKRTEESLNTLTAALLGAEHAAEKSTAQAAVAAEQTGRALSKVDDAKVRLEAATGTLPSQALVQGWYYLGKVSHNRQEWLPSSAKVDFTPPLQSGKNLLDQLRERKTDVQSRGYKYLRSLESIPGRRVDASIVRTLPPQAVGRIIDLDATGKDPTDGETVVWALVQVPPP